MSGRRAISKSSSASSVTGTTDVPGRAPGHEGDLQFMRAALSLATRGLGRVAPNPAVGCLIVTDGRVVGRGWTQPGGRPPAGDAGLRTARARVARVRGAAG